MRGRRLAILGGGLVLGAALLAWHREPAPEPRPPAGAGVTRAGDGPAAIGRALAPVAAAAHTEVEAPGPLPGSLDGTEPDGAITADAAGQLVIDVELRRLFDHFLTATGEEPPAAIRARIAAVLRARLPATAAGEGIAILDRYLAYREAARRLAPPPDPRAGLAQVHELRARTLSPEVAEALFAGEEAATHAALDRRDVLTDTRSSAAERERRLAEIDARLPAAVREARAAAAAPIDEMNREQALRAAGASDEAIAAVRTANLGAAAAARLAELDRVHAEWDARLTRFRAARAAVLADPRLPEAERRSRIDALLAQSFTPQERIRVEALDRISARPAGP